MSDPVTEQRLIAFREDPPTVTGAPEFDAMIREGAHVLTGPRGSGHARDAVIPGEVLIPKKKAVTRRKGVPPVGEIPR